MELLDGVTWVGPVARKSLAGAMFPHPGISSRHPPSSSWLKRALLMLLSLVFTYFVKDEDLICVAK